MDYYTDPIENTTGTLSDLEEDPFNPYEYEMRTYEKIYYFFVEYLVATAHMLLCVAILFASSLFFYAFYKFKRLQTRTNYILLNFYICITVSSVLLTLVLILEMTIVVYYRNGIPILFITTFGFLNAALIFALLLAQDWILSASNTRRAQKYQDFYKWMIGVVYLLIWSPFIIFLTCGHGEAVAISAGACALIYLINGIVLIVFNVIRYKRKFSEESKQILYALNVASVYYLMSLPPVSLILLGVLISTFTTVQLPFPFIVIMSCVTYFFEFISFSGPVVIVYLLAKWDKNFKMAYDHVFKSAVRKYQNVDNNLDEV